MTDSDDTHTGNASRRRLPWHAVGVAAAALVLAVIALAAAPRLYDYVTGKGGQNLDSPPTAAELRDRGAESIALLYSVDVPEDQLHELPTRSFAHAKVDLIVDGVRTSCTVTLVDFHPIRDAVSCHGETLPYR